MKRTTEHPRRAAARRITCAIGILAVCLIGIALAASRQAFAIGRLQASEQPKPQMAEAAFKNVQVLKGISVDDFMGTMGVMSAALGFDCSNCHLAAGFDNVQWDADTPAKRTARKMTEMLFAINRDHFQGRQVVTCWTCHRGRDRPLVTPTLEHVYGTPAMEMDDVLGRAEGVPSPDQVLDKYLKAIGGTDRLAKLTSYIAIGKSTGFRGFGGDARVEIVAKAPDRRATHITFTDRERGASVRTFDGRGGWMKTPLTVLGEYPLGGGELDGARLEAQLSFPGQIKQILTNWRVSAPTTIDERLVQVVQGNGPRGLVATLYFDDESGLLVRLLRYSPSPIGRVPTQVDYTDYRDVGGIKMPFRATISWLDGRDEFELTEYRLNVPIDAAKFGRPTQ
jgi:photosynthetic reaction center cytochrome c subunit